MSRGILVFYLSCTSLLFTLLGAPVACDARRGPAKTPVANDEKLAAGVWGGEHIQAEVTDKRTELEFDCAHGVIEGAIALNASGRFEVRGRYAAEHAGPVRDNETSNAVSVRYVGSLKNSELSLTIINADTKETLGEFTLTHGSDGRIRKCR